MSQKNTMSSPEVITHQPLPVPEYTEPPVVQDDPRDLLVDQVLSPYHIHYAEGIEGHSINPEAAELNFDTLLVLTGMIRDEHVTQKESKKGPWQAEPSYDWYFDKYQDQGVTKVDFDQPSKIVKMWLRKLGPHNDLSDTHDTETDADLGLDAADDILSARNWLLKEASAPNAKKPDYGLIAELNLELAEIGHNDNTAHQYLAEAAQYLDKHVQEKTASGEIDKAALARMKLTAVHIELARQQHLGTALLVRNPDEAQYARFEEDVETNLGKLRSYFHDTLVEVETKFKIDETDSPEEVANKTRYLAYASGRLFEVYNYLTVMDSLVETSSLAISKYRPGFYREESGTAHKVDNHTNNRQLNRNGETVELPEHGFNYNFDFVFNTLIQNPQPGEGFYRSAYYQLKIDPRSANDKAAKAASEKFFPGKKFFFVQPSNLDERIVFEGDDRKFLDNLMDLMQESTLTTEDIEVEQQ